RPHRQVGAEQVARQHQRRDHEDHELQEDRRIQVEDRRILGGGGGEKMEGVHPFRSVAWVRSSLQKRAANSIVWRRWQPARKVLVRAAISWAGRWVRPWGSGPKRGPGPGAAARRRRCPP